MFIDHIINKIFNFNNLIICHLTSISKVKTKFISIYITTCLSNLTRNALL